MDYLTYVSSPMIEPRLHCVRVEIYIHYFWKIKNQNISDCHRNCVILILLGEIGDLFEFWGGSFWPQLARAVVSHLTPSPRKASGTRDLRTQRWSGAGAWRERHVLWNLECGVLFVLDLSIYHWTSGACAQKAARTENSIYSFVNEARDTGIFVFPPPRAPVTPPPPRVRPRARE